MKILANEQRFLAIYLNPKAKPKDRLTFIEPVFESAGPALIALQSYRLEGCSGAVFCGTVNCLVEFVDLIETADAGGDIADKGLDYLKEMAVSKKLEVYYEQDGGESPESHKEIGGEKSEVTAALKMPENLTAEGKTIWKNIVKNKEWEIRKLKIEQKQQYVEHLYLWACKTASISPYQVAPEEDELQLYNSGFNRSENCIRDVVSNLKDIVRIPKGILLKYKDFQQSEEKTTCHFVVEVKVKDPSEKSNLEIHRQLVNFNGFKMISPHLYGKLVSRCARIQVEVNDNSMQFNVFVELLNVPHKAYQHLCRSWAKAGKLTKKDFNG